METCTPNGATSRLEGGQRGPTSEGSEMGRCDSVELRILTGKAIAGWPGLGSMGSFLFFFLALRINLGPVYGGQETAPHHHQPRAR